MSFIFVDCHSGLFILSDIGDYKLLSLLTIFIEDSVISEVYKGVNHCSKSFSKNETNLGLTAFGIEFLKFLETNEILSDTDQ